MAAKEDRVIDLTLSQAATFAKDHPGVEVSVMYMDTDVVDIVRCRYRMQMKDKIVGQMVGHDVTEDELWYLLENMYESLEGLDYEKKRME